MSTTVNSRQPARLGKVRMQRKSISEPVPEPGVALLQCRLLAAKENRAAVAGGAVEEEMAALQGAGPLLGNVLHEE